MTSFSDYRLVPISTTPLGFRPANKPKTVINKTGLNGSQSTGNKKPQSVIFSFHTGRDVILNVDFSKASTLRIQQHE